MEEMLRPIRRIGWFLARFASNLDRRSICLAVPVVSLLGVLLCSVPSSPIRSPLPILISVFHGTASAVPPLPPSSPAASAEDLRKRLKISLEGSRIAVCLVGGARSFELTGPSIVKRILQEYKNADLFLNSPLDGDAYKFSYLKNAPRLAAIRIFKPDPIPETLPQLRVLTASNSPNGIQGLLEYFNLVEGCVALVEAHQKRNNFTYDWIVRTRVDGYWSAPLAPENFVPAKYVVPRGSSYGGYNDRLGIGDMPTSIVALSRLSLIPKLDEAGFRELNSESAFKAQLTTNGIPCVANRLPFCIVTSRQYVFPPLSLGVPVAAMSSRGPLNGAKCRPCTPICVGSCVANVMNRLNKNWSWIEWEKDTLRLCNAHGGWTNGWERIFDRAAGGKLAGARRRIASLGMERCVQDFDDMRRRASIWDAPKSQLICDLGLPFLVKE